MLHLQDLWRTHLYPDDTRCVTLMYQIRLKKPQSSFSKASLWFPKAFLACAVCVCVVKERGVTRPKMYEDVIWTLSDRNPRANFVKVWNQVRSAGGGAENLQCALHIMLPRQLQYTYVSSGQLLKPVWLCDLILARSRTHTHVLMRVHARTHTHNTNRSKKLDSWLLRK